MKRDSIKLFSDLYTCAVAYARMHMHTHTYIVCLMFCPFRYMFLQTEGQQPSVGWRLKQCQANAGTWAKDAPA